MIETRLCFVHLLFVHYPYLFIMKILLVNKFYYLRGGDCMATFGTERLLRSCGHEVAIFSMRYPSNVPSEWERYFPKEVAFSFSTLSKAISAITRLFHSTEVARNFKRLLSDFQPDIVHLHNIHSYLSPLVARIAHQGGVRVAWTMHDFKLVCPSYLCLRDGAPCEACFKKKRNVILHRCMKGSFFASLLAFLEACYWNKRKLLRYTDVFISPSAFLKTKMVAAGFPSKKIVKLSNFAPKNLICETVKDGYYCYVGRLSTEKGVDDLLEVAEHFPYRLKVAGGGPLLEAYRQKYVSGHIEFLGQLPPDDVYAVVRKARLLVAPSVCYENNPLSMIEALCMGTPVCGADIGGIPELIEHGKNGYLFRAGDRRDLLNSMTLCFERLSSPDLYREISTCAQNKFGAMTFYHKLLNIYETKCF